MIIVNTKLQLKNNTFSMFNSKFFITLKTLILAIKKSKNRKKPFKWRKNYPIYMKIPGEHLQIVSNKCTNFQKIHAPNLIEHAWTNSCSKTGDRQTDRQTGTQTDRQTDKTDRVKPISLQTSFAGV